MQHLLISIGLSLLLGSTAVAAAAAPPASAAVREPDIAVIAGYVREPPPGQTVTSAYFRLQNRAQATLQFVGADSPQAASIEIHTHEMQDGVARMRKRASVSIPAGGSVRFAPGGLHLMLFRLRGAFAEGARIPLTLRFVGHADVAISLPVCSVRRSSCP